MMHVKAAALGALLSLGGLAALLDQGGAQATVLPMLCAATLSAGIARLVAGRTRSMAGRAPWLASRAGRR